LARNDRKPGPARGGARNICSMACCAMSSATFGSSVNRAARRMTASWQDSSALASRGSRASAMVAPPSSHNADRARSSRTCGNFVRAACELRSVEFVRARALGVQDVRSPRRACCVAAQLQVGVRLEVAREALGTISCENAVTRHLGVRVPRDGRLAHSTGRRLWETNMRTAIRAMLWLCVAVSWVPWAIAGSTPCVPEGGSVDVNFANPDISAYGPGAFIDSTALALEADPGSDDEIGDVDCSGGSATVTVSNDGDNLSAGDEVGDGETGTDCFEVYVEWTVVYYVSETYTADFAFGPFTIGKSFAVITKKRATIRSAVKDVCPC
jgi:hypothetical protein